MSKTEAVFWLLVTQIALLVVAMRGYESQKRIDVLEVRADALEARIQNLESKEVKR